jgi:hypothetical protein
MGVVLADGVTIDPQSGTVRDYCVHPSAKMAQGSALLDQAHRKKLLVSTPMQHVALPWRLTRWNNCALYLER